MLDQLTRGEARNLYRELNISNALSTVTYEADGVKYRRTSFISYPDQVMVIKIAADRPQAVSLHIRLNSLLRYTVQTKGEKTLILNGKAPAYVANRDYDPHQVVYDDKRGTQFKVQVELLPDGGHCEANDSALTVRNANEVVLLLSAVTDFGNKKMTLKKCKRPYQELLQRHTDDHQQLFNRLQLSLGTENLQKEALPTNERLKSFEQDPTDNGLTELYYQYGRYLLIASSRPGGLPANLQGIWNRHVQPPWGSNYTTNINTEMNYWPAEITNLPECFLPLSDFIGRLAVNGAQTAKVNYGINRGGQHWFDILLLDPVKRCAGQKTRLEYNGKKRKFLSVDSLYLMQTVCIDKGGLPFPQEKGLGIHMKNSFALYCIKELHFLMPVAVHPHGTLQVCLENVNAQRKKLITVGLCFFSVIHL